MKNMKIRSRSSKFSRQCAVVVLASAIGFPVWAQQQDQSTGDSQNTPPLAAQQQPTADSQSSLTPQKEGFWGRVNPWARKKWVKKQTDPINDRLSELDQVNARNARDIKDVDARAQAGIHQAQSTADAANQTASAASNQAQQANSAAQQASGHIDQLNSTVSGIDQYKQITDLTVTFRPGTNVLSKDSKEKLDELAAGLNGRQGYIVDIEAHSPASGSVGIQSSQRLADAVKRYLVIDHQIPVYRLHAVALGNAQMASASGDDSDAKPMRIRSSSVQIRLMENSLAAQASATPQNAGASTGTVQQ
jgi:outer membrane protein OmpA-like peptidoglycan-associated protein